MFALPFHLLSRKHDTKTCKTLFYNKIYLLNKLFTLSTCFFIFLQITPFEVIGQSLPNFEPVYPQDEITTIKIQIHPDSLAWILSEENLYSDHEFPATFIFESSSLLDTIENIGFRLRGNTSRTAAKKSFKVSFNTFLSQKWNGFEKLNLNGQHNDVSLLRTKLCWDMMREAGLVGSRVGFTKLYINDEFRGLYLNVEHIDENFAATYFDGEGDGNLFKCLYPADLTYLGSNDDSYKAEVFGRRIYELKTNLWQDNYADLADFVAALDNTSNSQLACELESVFDVKTYIKYAALEVLQGHWDGYIFNQNNYYLYHDQGTGLMKWIPYDLDNTLGIDWVNQDWASRNIYDWEQGGSDRPLFERLINNAKYRDLYSQAIDQYLNQFFESNWLVDKVDFYHNLISETVQEDPYFSLDYGFTYDQFLEAPTQAWGNQITYSIGAYFNQRKLTANAQLETFQIQPILSNLKNNGPSQDFVVVTCEASGVSDPILKVLVDNVTPLEFPMLDDGVFPDIVANDYIFTTGFDAPTGDKLNYQVGYIFNGNEQLFPCTPITQWLTNSPTAIQLNEVMPNNLSTVADEVGEYNDWIELYNSGNLNVNLSPFYLTDEINNWNKWKLPALNLFQNDFKVIWADDQPQQGNSHTNFQISANGETIWLIRYESNAPRIVDAIYVPACIVDESYGREMETSNEWIHFNPATPDAPNMIVSVEESMLSAIQWYPNPAQDILHFTKEIDSLQVFDLAGRFVLSKQRIKSLDTSGLQNGMYIFQVNTETFPVVISR